MGELGGMEGNVQIYQLTLNNFVIKITYNLIVLLFIPRDYCCMATPSIFMKRAAFRGVAAGWIRIKNTGDLRQRSVVASGLLYHVAWEESDTAAINAVCYPICGNRRLLPPLNLNLHLPKVHHHVLGQHLAAVVGVLLTRAPVTHLRPNNFHHNTGRMKSTFVTGAGAATTFAGVAISAVAGEHSFDAFATGAGVPSTVPAFFPTATGKAATAFATGLGVPAIFAQSFFACAAGIAPTTEGMPDIASANAACTAISPAIAPRTFLRFGWGVAHIGQ